jgi:superfamily I DNA/RNA helicase
MRANAYTNWHKTMSTKLFGIPNDRISCKKCSFFIKKFTDKMNTDINQSTYISDFINATDNLEFEMFLCDLATFTKNGKTVSSNIPILDISKPSNIQSLEIIRNIIKNSYEVKLMLSRQDEHELNSINKLLGEEESKSDKTTKYITMSQMFGHYMSHVITSNYIEIDYGYVLTVHKSQGSTYDNVYVEYSNILSNIKDIEKHKLLYTAITRCINKLHVYY